MKPSDFTQFPWDSALQKCEAETVAQNIMIILKRTENKFRELSYEEYKIERLKDGGFSEIEELYFNETIPYCKSTKMAKKFSKEWNKS